MEYSGGDGGGGSVVLGPEKIPSQYEGLSMGELAAKSSDISHQDIIGTTSEGEYTGGDNTEIAANILKHKGTLLHDIGVTIQPQRHPPGDGQIVAAVGQHRSPTRVWRLYTESDIAERRF